MKGEEMPDRFCPDCGSRSIKIDFDLDLDVGEWFECVQCELQWKEEPESTPSQEPGKERLGSGKEAPDSGGIWFRDDDVWMVDSGFRARQLMLDANLHVGYLNTVANLPRGNWRKATPLSSQRVDYEELIKWINNPNRKSAALAFTSGASRDAATAIEDSKILRDFGDTCLALTENERLRGLLGNILHDGVGCWKDEIRAALAAKEKQA